MNEQMLIIYHGACRDGFCAAWVLHKEFSEAEFFEGFYGKDPPDVTGRDVIIVDFSYKRPVLEQMVAKCRSILILDHHKTAEEDLKGYNPDPSKCQIIFDMSRSGAGLAWDHFHLHEPQSYRPWQVNYVEDRDLWTHKLPNTREINAFLSSIPFDFKMWDQLDDIGPNGLPMVVGPALMNAVKQYCTEVKKNAMRVNFHGYDVPMVNAAQVNISELLNHLAHDEKFAMGWFQVSDGSYNFSLRSIGEFDVSKIAQMHGGGGHKNAAGFKSSVPPTEEFFHWFDDIDISLGKQVVKEVLDK